MTQDANERATLRSHISELTAQMMLALKDPEAVPTLKDVRDTLGSMCDVYRLLHGTGDFDDGGSALDAYRGRMNGNGSVPHKNGKRNGSGRGGAGKRPGSVAGSA